MEPIFPSVESFSGTSQTIHPIKSFCSTSRISQLLLINSNTLAVVTKDSCVIELWNTDKDTLERLQDHSEAVTSLGLIDASTLISGGGGGVIKIWDIPTKKCLQTLETSSEHSISSVASISTPSFTRLAAWNENGRLAIWQKSNTSTAKFAIFGCGTKNFGNACLAFMNPDTLVFGQENLCLVPLKEYESNINLRKNSFTQAPDSEVTSLTVINQETLLSTHENPRLCIWDTARKGLLWALDNVTHAAVFAGGYITADRNGKFTLWHSSSSTFSCKKIFPKEEVVEIVDSKIHNPKIDDSKDEKLLATIKSSKKKATFKLPITTSLADTKDYTAIGTADGLYIWKESTSSPALIHSKWVTTLLALDSGDLAVAFDKLKAVYLWKIQSDDKQSYTELHGHIGEVSALGSIDSSQLVSGDESGNIIIWDIQTKKRLAQMKDCKNRVISIAATSTLLAAWDWNGALRTWSINDIRNPKLLQKYEGNPWPAYLAFIKPNQLVFGKETIAVIDPTQKTADLTGSYFEPTYEDVSSLTVLGSRIIASVHEEQRFCLWDTQDKEKPFYMEEGMRAAALFSGGYAVASSNHNFSAISIFRPEEDAPAPSTTSTSSTMPAPSTTSASSTLVPLPAKSSSIHQYPDLGTLYFAKKISVFGRGTHH